MNRLITKWRVKSGRKQQSITIYVHTSLELQKKVLMVLSLNSHQTFNQQTLYFGKSQIYRTLRYGNKTDEKILPKNTLPGTLYRTHVLLLSSNTSKGNAASLSHVFCLVDYRHIHQKIKSPWNVNLC